MSDQKKPKAAKVGDVIEIKGAATFVQLPDGSVVSAVGAYALTSPGEHVIEGVTYDAK